jgi:hypothetical protein
MSGYALLNASQTVEKCFDVNVRMNTRSAREYAMFTSETGYDSSLAIKMALILVSRDELVHYMGG